ncbi:MAG: hypothetical protein ACFCUR_12875 [Rhodomicrobiaceae bacterium]
MFPGNRTHDKPKRLQVSGAFLEMAVPLKRHCADFIGPAADQDHFLQNHPDLHLFAKLDFSEKWCPFYRISLKIRIISCGTDPDLHLFAKLDFSEKWCPFYRISL